MMLAKVLQQGIVYVGAYSKNGRLCTQNQNFFFDCKTVIGY